MEDKQISYCIELTSLIKGKPYILHFDNEELVEVYVKGIEEMINKKGKDNIKYQVGHIPFVRKEDDVLDVLNIVKQAIEEKPLKPFKITKGTNGKPNK